jgi:hypothetical protein
MRWCVRALALAALAPPLARVQPPAPSPRDIIRQAIELDTKNAGQGRLYAFQQRQEERQLDTAGRITSRDARTWDVTIIEGSPYRRLVARNDQPLGAKEQQLEEEKLRRTREERRRETPELRARRIGDWERKQQKQREPLREVPDAFDFKLVGEESFGGLPVYVIDASPHPGYKPKLASAAILSKVRARFWIGKNDHHWAKADMETLDTVAFGGFLLRLAKGTHLVLEQTRVGDDLWLPKAIDFQVNARVLLLKGLHREYVFAFTGYKKAASP